MPQLTLEEIVACAASGPSDADLKQISDYAREMQQLAVKIAGLEEQLKQTREDYRQIEELKLPDLMKQIGLRGFELDDQTALEIDVEYYASINQDNQAAASEWLRENNHDSIIKNEVKLSFGKGEDAEAAELIQELEEAGYSYEQKESVHASTLKAFVREQMEAGVTLPACFGVHVKNVAKIIVPKKKRSKR